jgi:carboxypeptidase Taq
MEFLGELKNIGKERALINSAVSLLVWDQRTYMPEAAYEYRADAVGYLSELSFRKFVSSEMDKLLEKMEQESSKNHLSEYEEKVLRMTKYEYNIIKSLPPELLKEITIESSKTEELWSKVKNEGDFNQIKKQLGKIIELSKEIAERIGY